MRSVEIVEVGPRDGLQSEPGVMPTAAKIEFIEQLIAAGLRRLEVASFVNPKRLPQMADAEQVLAGVAKRPDVHYVGLVLNRKGFDRAPAAGCTEVGMAVVASDTFNRRNQGVSTDESIAAWLDIDKAAHSAGIRAEVTVSAAFGCPFEGAVAPEAVRRVTAALLEAGCDEVAVSDTIGIGHPGQVQRLVSYLLWSLSPHRLALHFRRACSLRIR